MVEKVVIGNVGSRCRGLASPTMPSSSFRETREWLLPSQRCSQDLRVGGRNTTGDTVTSTGWWDHKQMWNCAAMTERWEKQEKIKKDNNCEKHLRCFMVFHYWWCKSITGNTIRRFLCFIQGFFFFLFKLFIALLQKTKCDQSIAVGTVWLNLGVSAEEERKGCVMMRWLV